MIDRFFPLLLTFLAAVLPACRTTNDREPSEASALKTSAEPNGPMPLAKDEEQALYLKMLSVELNAGLKVPKDQLHTSRGILECHDQGVLQTCLIRVRLTPGESSASQPVPPTLTPRFISYARASRPDLSGESVLLADLICDYIGKSSPPFNVEDVHCHTLTPRTPTEAVFTGQAAQEMGEAIRGDSAFGTQIVTLNGALACQEQLSSARSLCATRASVGGVLQDKVVELTPGTATLALKSLRQTVVDADQTGGPVSRAVAVKAPLVVPNEVMSVLTCIVDNTRIETEGKRTYVCRARI